MVKGFTMFKKLFTKLKSLFNTQDSGPEMSETILESHEQHVKAHQEAVKQAEEMIQVHLDTGKIIFPDNMSAEDKAEVEAALQELNESLQKLAPGDLFKSFEDFLSSGQTTLPPISSFTKANELEDGLAKITEEMQFCDENCEHWSDTDFVEALLDYENKGYEFKGFDEIYRKMYEKLELSKEESLALRQWYKLVSQDLVYDA
jgi:hypothetical protein